MEGTENGLLVVSGLLVVAVVATGFAGVATAGHGSPANFTVYPETVEDRNPDVTDGAYVMSSAGADAFDSERGLKYVDTYWIESDQASFAACNPDNARTFGIDRGNNNTGTQTDVDLLEHMKNYNVGDRRITLELYDTDDFGGDPINLNAPDATIAVLAGCVENTGDAGWYQFQGYVNGTTYDGGYEEVYLDSHYFWTGDFENEQAAREELGPPPSESGSGNGDAGESTPEPATPTPTAESTPDGGSSDGGPGTDGSGDDGSADDGSTDDGSGDGGSTGESTPESGTPAPTPTANSNGNDGGNGAADGGSTGGDEGSSSGDTPSGQSTPTPGDGPGFGSLVAIGALFAAALLARRL